MNHLSVQIILALTYTFHSLKSLSFEVHNCFGGFFCLHWLTLAQAVAFKYDLWRSSSLVAHLFISYIY